MTNLFFRGLPNRANDKRSMGASVGSNLAIASVTYEPAVTKRFLAESSFEIEIAGQRYPVQLQIGAPYDPSGSRMRR